MRRRHFESGTPANALTWSSSREKANALDRWRTAIGKSFPESGRVLRTAWALEWLFGADGFAYPTDGFLSRKLDIPLKKIQATLTELERAGAIIRASVMVRNRAQRRIWPSAEIVRGIPPTMGGIHTPHDGARHTPHNGGTEYLVKSGASSKRRFSQTQQAARNDAIIREESQARRQTGGHSQDSS